MAAGLGFKDFTTGEVLTAADVDGYLMQGVWVFASAAARDAAVTSPQEGNFAYLKDTNVTTYYTGSAWANLDTTGMTNPMTTTGDIIYSSSGSTPARLGIGSTGNVLTVAGGVPSWAAPAGGSGLTLISRTSVSGAGTHSFNNVFTSTYENYKIIIQSVTAGSTGDFFLRLRASGSDTTSNYSDQRVFGDGASAGAGRNTGSTTQWFIGFLDSGNANYLTTTMEIYNPQSAQITTGNWQNGFNNGGNIFTQQNSGWQSDATQFDGFTIRVGSGNVAATVTIYGYAK